MEYVYAARIVDTPFVKIGQTHAPKERLLTFMTQLRKRNMRCVCLKTQRVNDALAVEAALLLHFSPYRVIGEWFYLRDTQVHWAFSYEGLVVISQTYPFPAGQFIPAEVGQRIKALRKERKIGVTRFAQLARTSGLTIERIEAGYLPRISQRIITGIADVLGVSTDYLLGRGD